MAGLRLLIRETGSLDRAVLALREAKYTVGIRDPSGKFLVPKGAGLSRGFLFCAPVAYREKVIKVGITETSVYLVDLAGVGSRAGSGREGEACLNQ